MFDLNTQAPVTLNAAATPLAQAMAGPPPSQAAPVAAAAPATTTFSHPWLVDPSGQGIGSVQVDKNGIVQGGAFDGLSKDQMLYALSQQNGGAAAGLGSGAGSAGPAGDGPGGAGGSTGGGGPE